MTRVRLLAPGGVVTAVLVGEMLTRLGGITGGVALLAAVAALAHLARTGCRWSARRRRAAERRGLATARGWHFLHTAPGLAAELGDTWYGTRPAGTLVDAGRGAIPLDARAHAVLRGEVDGVTFAAFDYARPRRRMFVGPVATACVVCLPRRLPLFTSAEVFRHDGDPGARSAAGTPVVADGSARPTRARSDRADPDYARALLTPPVVALTSEEFPSWWITGSTLATVTRRPRGLPADALVRDIERITRLASSLDWAGLAPHMMVGRRAPVWDDQTD